MAVESAVFDEDFIGIHPGDDDPRQINARHVAFEGFGIADGPHCLGIDLHTHAAQQVEIMVPDGAEVKKVKLLTARREPKFTVQGGVLSLAVPPFELHEVVAVDLL